MKREVGDLVVVEADVFADGHDDLACDVLWRVESDPAWCAAPMEPLGNDRWRGTLPVERLGVHLFCVRASVDVYGTWLRETRIKAAAGQDVTVDLLVGAELLTQSAGRAHGRERARLKELATQVSGASDEDRVTDVATALDVVGSADVTSLVRSHRDMDLAMTSDSVAILVERRKARFSTWYELFPRSASPDPERHGTLADVKARLGYVSRLGFDVLYLPPIHPVGQTNRKGRDGARHSAIDDPGSPWAIGGSEGGHTAVHPQLGTLDDLVDLVHEAAAMGIELALDLAFQCSPDHPWVKEHPEWFRWLPDGTIRYAENPPKRYEDIYPIDFDTPQWRSLWSELLEVVEFWVRQGIQIFRVDNPHTKPLRLWEWLIAEVRSAHPDVIFLAEAFTRPKVMNRLAKAGFTQSYTYFAWRNTKAELEEYLTELHSTEVSDFFRPNFWPNTPDILTETLQQGGPAAFMARLVLAATAAASYGIYGPVFELCEHEPRTEGSEEYLHSEKYEVRHFDLDSPGTLAGFVARVNEIRRESLVLQHDRNLSILRVENDQLVAYARTAPMLAGMKSASPTTVNESSGALQTKAPSPAAVTATAGALQTSAPSPTGEVDTRPIVVVVNLDPHNRQSGWVELDLAALGIGASGPYEVQDLLTGARFEWQDSRNFVILDPEVSPAHILRVGAR